mgnify:CR=1 FL=1
MLNCWWRSFPKTSEVTGTFGEWGAAYSFLKLGLIASHLFSDNSYCVWPNKAKAWKPTISSTLIFFASFSRYLSKVSVHFAIIMPTLEMIFWALADLRFPRLAVLFMFTHISGFTRGPTGLPRFLGRECVFNFSQSLSEFNLSNHLLLISFSDTSWSVCSSELRSLQLCRADYISSRLLSNSSLFQVA